MLSSFLPSKLNPNVDEIITGKIFCFCDYMGRHWEYNETVHQLSFTSR
jgi:hypothetical protein